MRGIVETVKKTNESFEYVGKQYEVWDVTLKELGVHKHLVVVGNPILKAGDEIEFEQSKDKQGNPKISKPKVIGGADGTPASNTKKSNYWDSDAKTELDKKRLELDYKKQFHINRAVGLDKAINYYTAFKIPGLNPVKVLQTAEMFANFVQFGTLSEAEVPKEKPKAKPAPEPKVEENDGESDMPF